MGFPYLTLCLDDLFGFEYLARAAPGGNEVRHAYRRIEVGPICFASWVFPPEM